jgi:RecJ-like exonuclease
MGTCVICGKSVDGLVCESHQEDVLFHFEGDSVADLVVNRYYEGTVDGYADFGVFVDLADGVTGLLHRSEVPGRLESLDWEDGDTVYVQVTGVHENGNVDLGWSIRQEPREFRHELVQGAQGDQEPDESEEDTEEQSTPSPVRSTPDPDPGTERGSSEPEDASVVSTSDEAGAESADSGGVDEQIEAATPGTEAPQEEGGAAEAVPTQVDTDESPPARVPAADLETHVDADVTLEGELVEIHQTSGPTVLTLADESGQVECAAFVAPGERAYPEAEVGDVVRLVGEVERRRGSLQVETETLSVLEGEDAETVTERIETAREAAAEPPAVDLLVPDGPTASAEDAIVDTATVIRRAVFEPRPVLIRHAATVDGYLGSAAIERAILGLIEETHDDADAAYHFVDRQPLEDGFYDMSQATRDIVGMLEDAERHDEPHPLFVLVDAGSTAESLDGFEFLNVYDAEAVVVDGGDGDEEVGDAVRAVTRADTSATALGCDIAAHVNEAVRDDLAHLPAISFWEGPPQAYADLASGAGREAADVTQLREAIALEAYYHGHGSKRELITDLLWDEHQDLAAYVSSQFRAKLASELETAEPHLEQRQRGAVDLAVLDAHAFTHRFDFPPTPLLLDALHRDRVEGAETPVATLVLDEDVIRFRSTGTLSARDLATDAAEAVPEGGVRARGAAEGHVEFLRGERQAVLEAVVDAVADRLDEA